MHWFQLKCHSVTSILVDYTRYYSHSERSDNEAKNLGSLVMTVLVDSNQALNQLLIIGIADHF